MHNFKDFVKLHKEAKVEHTDIINQRQRTQG